MAAIPTGTAREGLLQAREREGTESVTGIKLGFQKDQNKSVTGGSVGTKKSVSGISVGVFMLAAVKEF